jgi:sugar-specific transcriptional regulator TrmB
MNEQALIEALSQLGLTQYEAKVYLALQGEDAAPVSRLQRKSGVPSGGVYTALDGLVARGFAELVLGTKKAYRCVPYERALENHQRNLDKQLEEMRADSEFKLSQARAALKRLAAKSPEPARDPTALGIRLVASKHALELYRELGASSKETLMCVTPPAEIKISDEQAMRERNQRKGMRWVLSRELLDNQAQRERMIEHSIAMGNVRFGDDLPMRFSIFDRKLVVLEMVEPDDSWQLLIIPNEAMAQTLAETFERLWKAATPAEQLKSNARRKSGA